MAMGYQPPAAPMPLILTLLQEATADCITFDTITIVPDHIAHLPCRNSKTWRKDHGWSDLEGGSGHSSSRWESSRVPVIPQPYYEEEACPAPPSPPKRQNSVSSTDMSLLAQARRQHSSSSLLSTSSSSTASTSISNSSSNSSRHKKKFQYPTALGHLPEDEPANTITNNNSRASLSSLPMPKPPQRQVSDGSSSRNSKSSSCSGGLMFMPCKPQRQASEQSFASQTKSSEQKQLHSRFCCDDRDNDNSGHSGTSTTRLHIPLSLFGAPSMPQRQESVSTLGSRQSSFSTLASQESNRSLMTSNSDREQQLSLNQPTANFRYGSLTQPQTVVEEDELIHQEPKEFSLQLEAPHSSSTTSGRGSFQNSASRLQVSSFLLPSLSVQ